MRFFRPWTLMRCLYPGAVFRVKTHAKVLYLTFDDGPDETITPEVLRTLAKYKVPAVFFCNGKKVLEFPGLADQIRSAGHIIGNHSFSHLDGWRTSLLQYVEDVYRADECTSSMIFRPPYGHLRPSQFRALRKKYHIFFWDLMPYDFDKNLEPEKIRGLLKKKIRPGSVIVLHDSPPSCATQILESFLSDALGSGYEFKLQVDFS